MTSEAVNENYLTKLIGEIGLYQFGICSFVLATSFFSQDFNAINFVNAYTDYWCKVPALANFSHEQQKYIAIPSDEDGEYSQCSRVDLEFDDMTEDDFYSWNRSYFFFVP